jgi:ATP-binding cassette subfamily F protein 3
VHYSGNYDQFEQTRNERLKQQTRAHEAQEAHKKHVQKFIDRFRYNANRAAQVQSRIKALKKLAPVPSVVEDPTLAFSFPQPAPLSPPIILFDKVNFGYTPEKTLLSNLTFNLDLDSRVALVGANGQGKSTILGLITGELIPTSGLRQGNSRAHIAKFSQHHMDQMPLALSALEFLMREFPGKDQSVYRECLGRYAIIGDMVFQRLATLSGGQKSRVAFAYLAMQHPHILVLDEPTNHLDIDTVSVLAEALNDFQGGVVLVSHDERLISLVCDQIWVVGGGELHFYPYDFEHYKKQLLKELQL